MTEQITKASGPAREGAALLQGLVVCGHCGHMMKVSYKQHQHYLCNALSKQSGQASCLWVQGPPVDEAVIQAFFAALQPAQLDVLEAVLNEQDAERRRLATQWQERLKRAEYEAQLAARQYEAVDPDNRLVAAELERRWEAALRQLHTTQEDYQRFQHTPTSPSLSSELRTQLQDISQRLPEVWSSLANDQKKVLLRSLIARVICKRQTPGFIDLGIVWVSGHYSTTQVWIPIRDQRDLGDYEKVVKRIEQLWREGLTDAQMAAQLTAEGFHSARHPNVLPRFVQKVRLAQGWHLALKRSHQALELDGYLTVRGLATQLGVQRNWVYRRLATILSNYVIRHPQNPQVYLIRNDPQVLRLLRQHLPENPSDKCP